MTRITIIANGKTAGEAAVTVAPGVTVRLPVGVEIAADDTLAAAATAQYDCLAGFFAADETAAGAIAATGIAEGSYVFVMSTQRLKFLSGGAWV